MENSCPHTCVVVEDCVVVVPLVGFAIVHPWRNKRMSL